MLERLNRQTRARLLQSYLCDLMLRTCPRYYSGIFRMYINDVSSKSLDNVLHDEHDESCEICIHLVPCTNSKLLASPGFLHNLITARGSRLSRLRLFCSKQPIADNQSARPTRDPSQPHRLPE